MKGSASGDLICQLDIREGPIYRRFSRRVVSENLDANIDFHVESAIYLCAGLWNLRCATASEWKAPISMAPSSCGVMLNTASPVKGKTTAPLSAAPSKTTA